jgi:hypothetical protein
MFGDQLKQCSMTEYLDYRSKIDKSGFWDSSNRIVHGLEAGFILSAIDKQRPAVGGWLKYCYGKESETLSSILSGTMRFELFPMSDVKKHQKLLSLCKVALDDYKLSQMNGRQMPVEVYVNELCANASNFSRDWGKQKRACLEHIRSWDVEGVANVSIMVRALKGRLEIDGREICPTEALSYCAAEVM